jgi:glycosidase
MEPAFWWTGMKNTGLQLMLYGKNIGRADVQLEYPGVRLKEIARADSPNYLFLYLDIDPTAKPGTIYISLKEGKKKKVIQTLELKPRVASVGARGFTPADVLYLLMPDRFANGDPSNDVWDHEPIDRNDPFGRHGGDFAGILQHLDYISDLGVTTVWLNPVLENKMHDAGYQSYHGYATTDFYQVDPRFGSNDDYCRLIDHIHHRGMKIVMDMIFNHCGSLHRWINDLPFRDWLNHPEGFVPTSHNLYSIMDIHAPPSEITAMTDGWFAEAMPDLNQRNRHLSTYLIQNSIWWIEYAHIDGIRHDTHPYADADFLARWCRAVFDEYPAFNIVGESWYLHTAPLARWQAGSKLSDKESHLKTVMDFNLMNTCNTQITVNPGENNPWRPVFEIIAQDFLYEDVNNLLVFLDNHDVSRFFKQGETNLDRYKQLLAFILTTRGIPQLYYGTEILMYGEKKDGDGLLRKDFPGGWPDDPLNAFTPQGRTALQNEAFHFLRQLLQWRKTSPAIAGGKLIHYVPDWETGCYVYARIQDKHRVLVVLNGSNREQTLAPEKYAEVIGNADTGREILSGRIIDFKEKITIPSKGTCIIELNFTQHD